MSESIQPVIFSYRPVATKTVKTPEEIKKWEHAMREFCGIKGAKAGDFGTLSTSQCGSPPDDDDCD
jgi:hypothetical protein